MSYELREVDRKEIFLQVVRLQDAGVSVDDSRASVSVQFGVDVDNIREIESEGITKKWPPL